MITLSALLLWSLLNATVYIDNADEYLIELFNDVTDEYYLTNRLYRVVKLENDIDLVLIDHVNTMESTRMLNVR